MNRLRLHQVIVQVVAFADDGDALEQIATNPIVIPMKEWLPFVDSGFDNAIEALRVEVEGAGDE